MVAPKMESVALEDLFADEDLKLKPEHMEVFADHRSPMVMLAYYRRLFPYKPLFQWLNQDLHPTKTFINREFALELQNAVYIRYNSFTNEEELKKEICRQNPARFEIGPVYTAKPKDRKTLLKSSFKPCLRELVFDIDMTDYDAIRTCCQDKAMCKRCWRFITMAVKVLDHALREDFGFEHLLWVYSGRRGIHCWVSDKVAMALTDDQRKSIVNYLEVIKGGKVDKRVDLKRPLHPSIETALDSLRSEFARVILRDQDCFAQPAQWELLLRLIPDKDAAARLHKDFLARPSATSTERWEAVRDYKTRDPEKHKTALQDVVLQYTYPRIDVEVSKHLNHLLKSPFCIHPGTGRVCVPLLASEVEAFDPDSCPTVSLLLEELETATAKLAKQPGTTQSDLTEKLGWRDTSLRPYVETFERHVAGILKESKKERVKAESYSMEF